MARGSDWLPQLAKGGKPRYLAIADSIEADMHAGRLLVGDRLPPQRVLAERLGLNFTTVARAYNEAQSRGLIEARVGAGSFVRARESARQPSRRMDLVDLTMNLPPEPEEPALLDRMRRGLIEVGESLTVLLRYQGFGGSAADKDAAVAWLGRHRLAAPRDRILVCPGAHSALLAILSTLAKPGDVIACEDLTYPGIRALAAQLGLSLVGLAMDGEGISADAFAEACLRHGPKALYCNPTLLNPTTATISTRRREALIAVARQHGVKIIEDDAYGCIPEAPPPALAALAPDITYYVAGLAKCLGAGLRIAYLVAPDPRSIWPLAASLRAATVMASPLTAALATHWINEGVAEEVLAAIRAEARARQRLAVEILPPGSFQGDPEAFHIWVPLPAPWSRSSFTGHMRTSGIGVVVSDAFAVSRPPPEAVRVCLGGVANRQDARQALEFLAGALAQSPAVASGII